MSVLADRKRKTKYILCPRTKRLWDDKSTGITFGKTLMEKMGWDEGKGLGSQLQGISEPIHFRYKQDNKGMGYKGNDDDWIQSQDEFNILLATLGGETLDKDTQSDVVESSAESIQSLELKSRNSKSRVHYQKFTRGKDLARYSENDLASIFGTAKQKTGKQVKVDNEPEDSSLQADNMETTSFGVTTFYGGSIQDYFKHKFSKRKLESIVDDDNNDDDDEGNVFYIGFKQNNGNADITSAEMMLDQEGFERSKKRKSVTFDTSQNTIKEFGLSEFEDSFEEKNDTSTEINVENISKSSDGENDKKLKQKCYSNTILENELSSTSTKSKKRDKSDTATDSSNTSQAVYEDKKKKKSKKAFTTGELIAHDEVKGSISNRENKDEGDKNLNTTDEIDSSQHDRKKGKRAKKYYDHSFETCDIENGNSILDETGQDEYVVGKKKKTLKHHSTYLEENIMSVGKGKRVRNETSVDGTFTTGELMEHKSGADTIISSIENHGDKNFKTIDEPDSSVYNGVKGKRAKKGGDHNYEKFHVENGNNISDETLQEECVIVKKKKKWKHSSYLEDSIMSAEERIKVGNETNVGSEFTEENVDGFQILNNSKIKKRKKSKISEEPPSDEHDNMTKEYDGAKIKRKNVTNYNADTLDEFLSIKRSKVEDDDSKSLNDETEKGKKKRSKLKQCGSAEEETSLKDKNVHLYEIYSPETKKHKKKKYDISIERNDEVQSDSSSVKCTKRKNKNLDEVIGENISKISTTPVQVQLSSTGFYSIKKYSIFSNSCMKNFKGSNVVDIPGYGSCLLKKNI